MEWGYRSGNAVDSALRALVAEAHGVDPARVELPRTRGAPEARIGGQRIEVSRSRSQGYVAAACAGPNEDFSLGIDIEAVRPFLASGTAPAPFADVVLAPQEMGWFRSTTTVDEPQRLLWLLRTWVRKEAVLKSLHRGFDTSRGGLPPAAVVLNEPWETPVCVSHGQVTVTDLPTRDAAGDSGSVILALAQNSGPVSHSPR